MHHYDELHKEPEAHEERCLTIWKQLAEHFASADDSLLLEPLNEPAFKLDADKWNTLLAKLLPIIRAKHPTRCLVVGPAQWNNFRALPKLVLPEDDRRLIVTFHYYDPFQFTHQGAHWVQGSDKWKGKTWTGSTEEQAALDKDFDTVAAWAKEHDRRCTWVSSEPLARPTWTREPSGPAPSPSPPRSVALLPHTGNSAPASGPTINRKKNGSLL